MLNMFGNCKLYTLTITFLGSFPTRYHSRVPTARSTSVDAALIPTYSQTAQIVGSSECRSHPHTFYVIAVTRTPIEKNRADIGARAKTDFLSH